MTHARASAGGVGPVLQSTAVGRAIAEAIERANPDIQVFDEGAYLRVSGDTACSVSRIAVEEQLGVDPERVKPESSFIDDLGADSLDIVELVMAMEEEFDIEIPDEDAEKLRTVADVTKYLEAKGKA